MSFPNIPDINPYISIKLEDAINLLLTSIAMEEISLSKLMDAEKNKILCVLDNCKHHECSHKDSVLHDAIAINKSVDDTIKNMIKLQMLLQFKLENVTEILAFTSSTTTTSTSSTTTTTHTTTSTTSTCTTTTKKECSCSLNGNAKGCITNCCDEFCGQMALLHAFVFFCDVKSRIIRYSVGHDDDNLHLYASGYNINIQCPDQSCGKVFVFGKGYSKKYTQCSPCIKDNVDFILTVCNKVNDNLEFRMEIKSHTNPRLNHDSGFVQVKKATLNQPLILCCDNFYHLY